MVDTGAGRMANVISLKRALFVLTGFVVLFIATIGINLGDISLVGVFKSDVNMTSGTGPDDQDEVHVTNQTDIHCNVNISVLETHANLSTIINESENYTDVLRRVTEGGTFTPDNCTSVDNVAIIVPYRDREDHLEFFLPYMHRYLQKQSIQYTIFIIEQNDTGLFNRGLLMNAGYIAATRFDNFTCLILHDVDLLPTNELNIYRCSTTKVKHMSTANSKYKFKIPYPTYFGGIVAATPEAFKKANGFSNLYFGWGQEDDDFFVRIKKVGLAYERVSTELGRYESLNHTYPTTYATALMERKFLTKTIRARMSSEGLNSFENKDMPSIPYPLYTLVQVRTDESALAEKFFTCNMKAWPCPIRGVT